MQQRNGKIDTYDESTRFDRAAFHCPDLAVGKVAAENLADRSVSICGQLWESVGFRHGPTTTTLFKKVQPGAAFTHLPASSQSAAAAFEFPRPRGEFQFGIRISSLIRISGFDIRHFPRSPK